MKIGILYICTGKYDVFFDSFYESSEQYFQKKHTKQYFVFTDSNYIFEKYKDYKNIDINFQRRLGFPLDTLMRFWMFKGIESKLSGMDFLIFFNANFEFLSEIGDDFLPNGETERLVAGLHGWFYNRPSFWYSYERNPSSTAYIPYWKSGKYYQGSLNGGFTKDYLKMVNTCIENINKDFLKNYIAKWHDESHLNKYLFGRKDVKALNPSYNYPEGSNLPFKPKILLKNKDKRYGYAYLRSTNI